MSRFCVVSECPQISVPPLTGSSAARDGPVIKPPNAWAFGGMTAPLIAGAAAIGAGVYEASYLSSAEGKKDLLAHPDPGAAERQRVHEALNPTDRLTVPRPVWMDELLRVQSLATPAGAASVTRDLGIQQPAWMSPAAKAAPAQAFPDIKIDSESLGELSSTSSSFSSVFSSGASAIQNAGSSALRALEAGASGVGAMIGNSAANSLRAAASALSISVNVKAPVAAPGDTGAKNLSNDADPSWPELVFRSTLSGMAHSSKLRRDGENARQYFRRLQRRDYLTGYEQERRRQATAEGSRRIDVTLDAKALEDYATVLAYLRGLNKKLASISTPLVRVSAQEVIRLALSHAAFSMWEDYDQAAKKGSYSMLAEGLAAEKTANKAERKPSKGRPSTAGGDPRPADADDEQHAASEMWAKPTAKKQKRRSR
jgi:hypothetical protein